ncbi:MAG: hypothetical protein HUJ54_02765 [Erysipelotrichaceae bacterium]|nr:hypothetical protein [Erysipelotrichaceae bacterium]
MKHLKTTLGLLTGCLLLTGCSMAAANPASLKKAANQTAVSTVNPVRQVTIDEMGAAAGIYLRAPEGAGNVVYSVISDSDGGKTAQAEYTVNGVSYTYRAKSIPDAEAHDISGLYEQWTAEAPVEIGYHGGTWKTSDNASVIIWTDIAPGISYSLSVQGKADQDQLLNAAREVYVPVQGEAG